MIDLGLNISDIQAMTAKEYENVVSEEQKARAWRGVPRRSENANQHGYGE